MDRNNTHKIKNMRKSLLNILMFIFSLSATAQITNDTIERNKIDNIALRTVAIEALFPEERVYLHFDNTAYYLTETIWFKAYVVSGNSNRPTTMSRVLYVELVAPEGYVVETKKYHIDEDGCCNGEFHLNALLLSGYYEIRAYTRYMLNRDESAVFSRVFPIFDKVNGNNWDFRNMLDRRRGFLLTSGDTAVNNRVKKEWVSSRLPKCDVKFYPEGGHLVNNIESNVAFEVFAADGINSNKTIKILANGKELLQATPSHFGKGSFRLTPKSGVKYTAILQNDKKEYKFALPEVMTEGIVPCIEDDGENININITNNLLQEAELGCAILHRGRMLFYERYNAKEHNMLFSVDKKILYEGVNRLVLFADDSIPLAERMFFVTHTKPTHNDNSRIKLSVESNIANKKEIGPHEKITLKIRRADGLPLTEGNFSLSVSDADCRDTTSYNYNIYTYMLLGSELKGYIPDAARYFDPKNSNRSKELDLIMLTHGWSSYDWHKLTTRQFKLKEPIERGIIIKGRFLKKRDSRKWGKMDRWDITPRGNTIVDLTISYSDSLATRYRFLTDYNGEFRITTNDFNGKRVARLTPDINNISTKDSIFAFALDRYFSPQMRLLHYWERNVGKATTLEEIEQQKMQMIKINPFQYLLTQVDVVSKKKNEPNYRPPRSEMRLDFLDEWEYAQDVTYLIRKNSTDIFDDSEYFYDQSLSEHNSSVEPISGHQYYIESRDELSSFDRSVMRGMHINSVSENRIRHSSVSRGFSTGINPIFYGQLSAADVLRSAFWRHNLNWCYWIQGMVVDGEYHSDSVPKPNREYIRGVHPSKMMDFKEIIIRSDERTRSMFGKGKRIKSMSGKTHYAYDYSKFYESFMGRMAIDPMSGKIEDAPDPITLAEHNKYLSAQAIPNYVACFIPNSEEDKASGIIPMLSHQTTTRYTMVYGYNESKKFYSPDYSTMQPDSSSPDYRRTLLWVPEATVRDGSIEVELYNSSCCKRIAIDIEGYSNGTFFGNNIIETREAPARTDKEDDYTRNLLPAVGISEPRLLAHCFKITEKGRDYFRNGEYEKAFNAFCEASGYGYPDALYNCAVCYMEGRGTTQDFDEGFRFFRKAANLGNKNALHNLASCYMLGIGTAQNDTLAAVWYLKSAINGHPMSQTVISNCYRKGTGIEQDSTKAEYWLGKAVESEEPTALYQVGSRMAKADSVSALSKRKLRKQPTINYIEKAARKNNIEAQYDLGKFYESGRYVKKSKKKAFYWYRRAANDGHKAAILKVAQCYEKGKGVKQNDFEAARWYRIAEQQGNQYAKEKMAWYNLFKFFGKH